MEKIIHIHRRVIGGIEAAHAFGLDPCAVVEHYIHIVGIVLDSGTVYRQPLLDHTFDAAVVSAYSRLDAHAYRVGILAVDAYYAAAFQRSVSPRAYRYTAGVICPAEKYLRGGVRLLILVGIEIYVRVVYTAVQRLHQPIKFGARYAAGHRVEQCSLQLFELLGRYYVVERGISLFHYCRYGENIAARLLGRELLLCGNLSRWNICGRQPERRHRIIGFAAAVRDGYAYRRRADLLVAVSGRPDRISTVYALSGLEPRSYVYTCYGQCMAVVQPYG